MILSVVLFSIEQPRRIITQAGEYKIYTACIWKQELLTTHPYACCSNHHTDLHPTSPPGSQVLTGRTGAHLPPQLAGTGLYIMMGDTSQGLKLTGVSWLKEKSLKFMEHFTIT